ncbi:acetyl-CoA C-acetyltransferase [Mycobacterium sp.]|jgi:acetyl-CoA C-acetyltransferase|uniref:acetyl-CoA C-acetyltransferase n=1 Tax=Mycobacterium sp. TaxID=1785 RepID=UPI003340FE5F|nr:acetyl-CoA acetyltransferase [Mycobacterium sp.]
MPEALIIDAVRSPRGKGKATGALHDLHPQELLAQVLNALCRRVGIDPADVDDVQIGNASGEGDHGMCIGRLSVLAAGWPVSVPAVTVNRYCGSGQQAVTHAATAISAGHQDAVVAGGVESMSRLTGTVPRFDANNPDLLTRHPLVPQGISADLIATLEGYSRDDVDGYALRSHRRAAAAAKDDRFDASIIAIVNADNEIALDHDEHLRPNTTLTDLAALRPSFERLGAVTADGYPDSFDAMARRRYPEADPIRHVHHAGNSAGVVDGAAAMLLASPEFAQRRELAARARVVMTAVAGAEPVIMLTAPADASRKCLAAARMSVSDIDLWEINEAFAAVVLKAERDLMLDAERVNVNGGAIALGHPIGASGPILIQTVLDELERRDLSTALVTMCTGAGMATATIIERV